MTPDFLTNMNISATFQKVSIHMDDSNFQQLHLQLFQRH